MAVKETTDRAPKYMKETRLPHLELFPSVFFRTGCNVRAELFSLVFLRTGCEFVFLNFGLI